MSSSKRNKGNRGYSNKAKSGSRAATTRWQQSAAKAKLERPGARPKPRKR